MWGPLAIYGCHLTTDRAHGHFSRHCPLFEIPGPNISTFPKYMFFQTIVATLDRNVKETRDYLAAAGLDE
jgi:hypothetical protein